MADPSVHFYTQDDNRRDQNSKQEKMHIGEVMP